MNYNIHDLDKNRIQCKIAISKEELISCGEKFIIDSTIKKFSNFLISKVSDSYTTSKSFNQYCTTFSLDVYVLTPEDLDKIIADAMRVAVNSNYRHML